MEALHSRIDQIVEHVNTKVETNAHKLTALGFRHGILGLSLYNYILAESYHNKSFEEKGDYYLEQTFNKLNEGYVSPTLYREIAEFGWFVEHIHNFGYGLEDTNEVLNDVDDMLMDIMQQEKDKQNFDPVTGVLAYGYYFLARVNSRPELKQTIIDIVTFLRDISHHHEKGIFWKSKLKDNDAKYMGITHGLANIIAFCIYAKRIIPDIQVDDLILGGANYLKRSEQPDQRLVYPIIEGEDDYTDIFPKSYCYGDYGTLYAVLAAFHHTQNQQALQEGVEIFQTIFQKGHAKPYLVAGPSILYGHAGLAMLFNRFHELSPSPHYANAYEHMISELVEKFDPNDEVLGFKGYWNQGEPFINYSFAEGMMGIASVLLTHKSKQLFQLFDTFYFIRTPVHHD